MPLNLELMRRLLRPATNTEIDAVVRSRVGDGACEMLTLADAGVEDEVRELLAPKEVPSRYTR